MKKFLLVTALAMATSTSTVMAKTHHGKGHHGGTYAGFYCSNYFHIKRQPFKHLDRLQFILGLSEKQVKKVYNLHKEFLDRYFNNRRNSVALAKIRVEHEKKFKALLTPNQKKRWENFKKSHGKRRHGKHNSGELHNKKGQGAGIKLYNLRSR